MIGIIARRNEENIAREFFELFKTPWEIYKEDKWYDVVVCTGDASGVVNGRLVVVYGTEEKRIDSVLGVHASSRFGLAEMNWNGILIPVYTGVSALEATAHVSLALVDSGEAVGIVIDGKQSRIARITYDLFREVDFLLSSGQPSKYAHFPTLELHIAILRNLMVEAQVSFVEIPPVPYGYDYIVCLTHDIDFVGIRNHKFDHTMFGFLYRALWQTFIDALGGKIKRQKLWKNVTAVLLLPAVYLGIAKDFWVQFDSYRDVEGNVKSTFFFLPYSGKPGRSSDGVVPAKRACKYDVRVIKEHVAKLQSEGCEIGLHGLDAWHDSEMGKKEAERVGSVAGYPVSGVRMHWLYYNNESPRMLEKAGFRFDSSCGYNDAVGFRAGTAQVFRPLVSREFFELPLLIQDTAMFYSGRMNLVENEAFALCESIIEKVVAFGGVLVINWHHRSLAPERLWGDFYARLLNEIGTRKVWFGTGREVVDWFTKRRRVGFREAVREDGIVKLKVEDITEPSEPGLKLRLYGDWDTGTATVTPEKGYKEIPLQEDMELHLTPTYLAC